jgi:hypothetical protein
VTNPEHTHEAAGGTTVAADGLHNVMIRYFVALQDPGYPHQNSADRYSDRSQANPVWTNSNVSADILGGPDVDNVYVLYRIEFDTEDPAFANWVMPDPGWKGKAEEAPLVINPNFFYDSTPASNGEPYWKNWRRNAVAQTALRDIDLVRFTRDNNGVATQVQSTVTFTPTVVQNDAAVPAVGQEETPVSYVATHGNWTGVQNDGTLTAADYSPPPIGTYPRIKVYHPVKNASGGTDLVSVYDNWATGGPARPGNSRVLTWDSRTGTIRFVAGGRSSAGQAQEVEVSTVMTPSMNGWEFDPLQLAAQQSQLSLPNSLKQYVRIVPGSETVSVTYQAPVNEDLGGTETDGGTGAPRYIQRTDLFRRSADNRTMDTANRPADWNPSLPYPATLPEPGTYVFDSETGRIILGFPWPGPDNPLRPQPIPQMLGGQPPKITIRFAYQTNQPEDIVRVDYATRSLVSVNMGIRMFDPSTNRPILSQLTDRIAMRNTGR